MNEPSAKLTPWIDILPPPAPSSEWPAWLLVILLVMTITILVVVLRYWYTRPKHRAQRHLKHIQQQLKNPQHDTKSLAFAIAAALRMGFGVSQLTQIAIFTQQPQVQLFCQDLRRGCYQPTSPTRDELRHWLQQARHLLQQTWFFHARS